METIENVEARSTAEVVVAALATEVVRAAATDDRVVTTGVFDSATDRLVKG